MSPEFSTATIVLLGKFDPDAFLPDALVRGKVIPKKEAERIKFDTLVRGQIVQFELSWSRFLASTDRFQIATNEAPYVRICDFATKALNDLPTESTVTAFGINLECHFDLGSIEARDVLGKRLAPPNAWGPWGDTVLKNMQGKDMALHGGVMHLQMRQPFVEDGISGWLDVFVGPSARIPDSTGVFFRTNHHHHYLPQAQDSTEPIQKNQPRSGGGSLLAFLAERFDSSISSAESIFEGALAK